MIFFLEVECANYFLGKGINSSLQLLSSRREYSEYIYVWTVGARYVQMWVARTRDVWRV
jgi:hypothetical protein